MHSFKLAAAAVDAAADAVAALLNGGRLRIYSGKQPANADARATGAVLLAELAFGRPAFSPAKGGVATARAIAQDPRAAATGTASWFRAFTASDEPVFDGSVGTRDCDLNLGTVTIRAGAIVSVSKLVYQQPRDEIHVD